MSHGELLRFCDTKPRMMQIRQTVLWRVQDPTDSPLLEGRWRLLFTTRPGSASPIQKTFVGVESFTVYQEVLLTASEGARVNNIVDFGAKIGTLKVLWTFNLSLLPSTQSMHVHDIVLALASNMNSNLGEHQYRLALLLLA